jgi:hypothetical protein
MTQGISCAKVKKATFGGARAPQESIRTIARGAQYPLRLSTTFSMANPWVIRNTFSQKTF